MSVDIFIPQSVEIIPAKLRNNFWLVSADMGYGHQRAIYPLTGLAKGGKVLTANNASGASQKEIKLWREMQRTYEFLSRAGKFPLIGHLITRILDNMLYIPEFYPLRDRSTPTIQVRYLKRQIKKGLCKAITDQIKDPDLPLITSFYLPAVAADMSDHGKIFCIICDTDLNRVWAPYHSSITEIIYFASGTISAKRLLSYGVPERNIIVTGFPLPVELLGDGSLTVLKDNLARRLVNLDPSGTFSGLYRHSINAYLENWDSRETNSYPLTITYAVGGAGAQKEIGKQVAKSLFNEIESGKVNLNLVAGTRPEVRDYFLEVSEEFKSNTNHLRVIWAEKNELYFDLFNECLKTTDILWTKPSELSFYCALGLPIITTPAIGPQERCNYRWLREIGAGFRQQNPDNTNQWLFDMLYKGRFAEAAWNGFLKARKFGTFNILEFLEKGAFTVSNDPLKR